MFSSTSSKKTIHIIDYKGEYCSLITNPDITRIAAIKVIGWNADYEGHADRVTFCPFPFSMEGDIGVKRLRAKHAVRTLLLGTGTITMEDKVERLGAGIDIPRINAGSEKERKQKRADLANQLLDVYQEVVLDFHKEHHRSPDNFDEFFTSLKKYIEIEYPESGDTLEEHRIVMQKLRERVRRCRDVLFEEPSEHPPVTQVTHEFLSTNDEGKNTTIVIWRYIDLTKDAGSDEGPQMRETLLSLILTFAQEVFNNTVDFAGSRSSPAHMLVMDEMAAIAPGGTEATSRPLLEHIQSTLRDIVMTMGACGVITVLGAQQLTDVNIKLLKMLAGTCFCGRFGPGDKGKLKELMNEQESGGKSLMTAIGQLGPPGEGQRGHEFVYFDGRGASYATILFDTSSTKQRGKWPRNDEGFMNAIKAHQAGRGERERIAKRQRRGDRGAGGRVSPSDPGAADRVQKALRALRALTPPEAAQFLAVACTEAPLLAPTSPPGPPMAAPPAEVDEGLALAIRMSLEG